VWVAAHRAKRRARAGRQRLPRGERERWQAAAYYFGAESQVTWLNSLAAKPAVQSAWDRPRDAPLHPLSPPRVLPQAARVFDFAYVDLWKIEF
jgi:hypothetical protein